MSLTVTYLLAFIGSIALAALSTLGALVNPVTGIFLQCAAPLARLLGRQVSDALGAWGPLLWVSALWPLSLPLLHGVVFQLLRWPWWSFPTAFLVTGILTATLLLFLYSAPE